MPAIQGAALYSARSASMGSRARRVGKKAVVTAAAWNTMATLAVTLASMGLTPYSMAWTRRPARILAAQPPGGVSHDPRCLPFAPETASIFAPWITAPEESAFGQLNIGLIPD